MSPKYKELTVDELINAYNECCMCAEKCQDRSKVKVYYTMCDEISKAIKIKLSN